MSKGKNLFSSCLPLLLLLLLCSAQNCKAKNISANCITSSCGNINISYPFRLRGDPANCGYPGSIFTLECQKNRTTVLHTDSRRYNVESITYSNYSIRISDPGLDRNNLSSCLAYSYIGDYMNYGYIMYRYYTNNIDITFINCLNPVANPKYIENTLCGNTSAFSNSTRVYSYVTVESILVSDLEDSCTYDTTAQASPPWPSTDHNYSYAQIHDLLSDGFELVWYKALCTECYERKGDCSLVGDKIECHNYCYESSFEEGSLFCGLVYVAGYLFYATLAIGALIVLRLIIGIPCLIGVVVNERRRRLSSMKEGENIEELLCSQVNHMPISYSYREIKKMTQNFKNKLGGGAHGTVFRGELRSGFLVAVKMVTSSSASDKEFIKYASAISRTSNGNLIKLFGFCIEGTKRALVYEFSKSGSLEEHLLLKEGEECGLSVRDMFKISVGVARGIQCLHGAKIIHLGIKPLNILLDKEFNPKVSDSGLGSLRSLQYHRMGTLKMEMGMGFMPPEVFYKNNGGVSCKADVYSFGMVVLEMAARLNTYTGKQGEVYFPLWIHKKLCEEGDLGMGGGEEEEEEEEEERAMVEKMIVVGLWCIQMKAGDRPLMEEVVGMLEGGIELLQIPPMPFHRAMDCEESSMEKSF